MTDPVSILISSLAKTNEKRNSNELLELFKSREKTESANNSLMISRESFKTFDDALKGLENAKDEKEKETTLMKDKDTKVSKINVNELVAVPLEFELIANMTREIPPFSDFNKQLITANNKFLCYVTKKGIRIIEQEEGEFILIKTESLHIAASFSDEVFVASTSPFGFELFKVTFSTEFSYEKIFEVKYDVERCEFYMVHNELTLVVYCADKSIFIRNMKGLSVSENTDFASLGFVSTNISNDFPKFPLIGPDAVENGPENSFYVTQPINSVTKVIVDGPYSFNVSLPDEPVKYEFSNQNSFYNYSLHSDFLFVACSEPSILMVFKRKDEGFQLIKTFKVKDAIVSMYCADAEDSDTIEVYCVTCASVVVYSIDDLEPEPVVEEIKESEIAEELEHVEASPQPILESSKKMQWEGETESSPTPSIKTKPEGQVKPPLNSEQAKYQAFLDNFLMKKIDEESKTDEAKQLTSKPFFTEFKPFVPDSKPMKEKSEKKPSVKKESKKFTILQRPTESPSIPTKPSPKQDLAPSSTVQQQSVSVNNDAIGEIISKEVEKAFTKLFDAKMTALIEKIANNVVQKTLNKQNETLSRMVESSVKQSITPLTAQLNEMNLQISRQIANSGKLSNKQYENIAKALEILNSKIDSRDSDVKKLVSEINSSRDNLLSPVESIKSFVDRGEYENAFVQAMETANIEFVMNFIKGIKLDSVFLSTGTCVLSQPVILSLIQFICYSLEEDIDVKFMWLEEAIMCLNSNHPLIVQHLKNVLNLATERIQQWLANASQDNAVYFRQARILLKLIAGLQQ